MRLIVLLTASLALITGCGDDTTSPSDSGSTDTGSVAGCTDPASWFGDSDGDGFGAPDVTEEACEQPQGFVDNDLDCDDDAGAVNPDADEVCDDLDNDCDGTTDVGAIDEVSSYADLDSDGYGDPETEVLGCDVPSGMVGNDRDCDDEDPSAFPGATEACDFVDQDCDDRIDEGADGATEYHADADEDGWGDASSSTWACDEAPEGTTLDGSDCDDTDPLISPDGQESCDGELDEDCDGTVDEANALNTTTFYADSDLDGFGDAAISTDACTAPSGYSADDTDCDDLDATEYPGVNWYADVDGDTYGDPDAGSACERANPSDVLTNDDCNDTDDTVYPSAAELCDGQLNDCLSSGLPSDESDADGDGWVSCTVDAGGWDGAGISGGEDCDDGDSSEYPGVTWYADGDGDGWGDASSSNSCERASSSDVGNGDDCDDGDAGVSPSATESCDGSTDEDCDGSIDEGLTSTYYRDADVDGYGTASTTTEACSEPSGYVSDSTDCNDSDAGVNPGSTEVCDGSTDEDCDSSVDEGVTSTYYNDFDGDGYGSAASTTTACSAPSGYVSDSTDCDDTNASANPGATEVCDGSTDEDCDSGIDEGVETTYYRDADRDTYGDASDTTDACSAPTGYVSDATDCDDGDDEVSPGASERCDGVDTDCDGSTSEDGYASFVHGTTGSITDITSDLTPAGASLASYQNTSSGELWFCDGTWNVELDVRQDLAVRGLSGDRDKVVLDGLSTGRPVTVDKNGLTVSVADLTITAGYATDDLIGFGYDSGGAVACQGVGTSLTLDNVVLTANYAPMAGAVSGSSCDLAIDGSEISSNGSYYGGAGFLDGVDLVMTDSQVLSNSADYGAGAFYLYTDAGPTSFDMTDSLMDGNQSPYGYGGAIYGYSYANTLDIRCAGSAGATSGFVSNTSSTGQGGGLYLSGTYTTFDASTCDFGTTAGGDTNSPQAIYTSYGYDYEPGDDASFGCDGYECGDSGGWTVGGDDYSFGTSPVAFWNIFQADHNGNLEDYGMSLRSQSGNCYAELYVMETDDYTDGEWVLVDYDFQTISKSTSFSHITSNTLNYDIDAGQYYALVTATDCGYTTEVEYGYSTPLGSDVGWGTLLGGWYTTGYSLYDYYYSSGASGVGSPQTYSWAMQVDSYGLR